MLSKNQSDLSLSPKSKAFHSCSDRLKVAIRIRPPLPREIEPNLPFRSIALVSKSSPTVSLVEYLGCEYDEAERQREWVENPNYFQYHRFTFDNVFDPESTQEEVYKLTALPAVNSILEGYNSTILAYGQTGTGKTYTMEGFTYDYLNPSRGIIPRTIEDIFHFIEGNANSNTTFIIRATYLQIYNESISDLLRPEKKNLGIREDKKKGLYVESLSEWAVRSPNDIYALLERGASCRAKANTNMNDVSSRSHAVFSIQVEQMTIQQEGRGKHIKVGKLNLVDLAGSERIKVTGATGKQLEESKKINKSLSALGNVIYALTDPKGRTHIPYRDSKLTRLLENSLGGNCKTTMIAMISPAQCSFNESLSTLNFAKRAKTLKTKATINEDIDHNALIRQYENELKKLRIELEEKEKLLKNNDFIAELEEKKKEAERDKDEAIQALEEASIKYLQERDEKKKLEAKINLMNFQMIPGGQKINIEETPQFQTLLQKHQILLEKDFNEKLNEIEREREAIQASKEQVDSYNKLLYKQRDIMNGLTASLNERDENIAQLQEEIEAYDKLNKEQEELISLQKKRLLLLEGILTKNKISFPVDENNLAERKITKNPLYNSSELNIKKKVKLYPKYDIGINTSINNCNNHAHSLTDNLNNVNIMLTPEEKITELLGIIQEKEKEIMIMKKVSDKLLNNAYENAKVIINDKNDSKINNSPTKFSKEIIDKIRSIKEKYGTNNHEIQQDIDDILQQISFSSENQNDYPNSKKISINLNNVQKNNSNHKTIHSMGPENSIKNIKIKMFQK